MLLHHHLHWSIYWHTLTDRIKYYHGLMPRSEKNSALCILLMLTFSKRFKDINILFLVKGHTKKSYHGTFNLTKKWHHKSSLWTHGMACAILDKLEEAQVLITKDSKCNDWDAIEDLMFREFSEIIIDRNHIFSSPVSNIV